MKQLIVMRHGEAQTSAPSDRERALTESGMSQVQTNVKTVQALVKKIDCCLVSPYRRAQETARIVNKHIHFRSFEDSELITPEADCRITTDLLSGLFQEHDSIFLVSHMPFVANLVNHLAGDREEPVFGFVPAEIIQLDFELFGQGLGSVKRLA